MGVLPRLHWFFTGHAQYPVYELALPAMATTLQQCLPKYNFFLAPANRLSTVGTNILGTHQDLSLFK